MYLIWMSNFLMSGSQIGEKERNVGGRKSLAFKFPWKSLHPEGKELVTAELSTSIRTSMIRSNNQQSGHRSSIFREQVLFAHWLQQAVWKPHTWLSAMRSHLKPKAEIEINFSLPYKPFLGSCKPSADSRLPK